jgi:hypothetical protein
MNILRKKSNNPISSSYQHKKYLGINLTEEVNDLYNENYKALMKEIREDTNKWKQSIHLTRDY